MTRNGYARWIGLVVIVSGWTGLGCATDGITGLGDQFEASTVARLLGDVEAATEGNVAVGHVELVADILADPGLLGAIRSPAGTGPASKRLARRAETMRAVAERLGGLDRPLTALRASMLPPSLLGKTLVLKVLSGYVVDESLDGAPEDGVRFTLYKLNDLTGRPQMIPPSVAGWLDVVEESGPRLQLTAASNDTPIADYYLESSLVLSEESFESSFAAAGFIYGRERVDFVVDESIVLSNGSQDLEVYFARELSVPEYAVSARLFVEGALSLDPGRSSSVDVTLELEDGTHVVVMKLTDTGLAVDGFVSFDGEIVLLMSGDPAKPTFATPDGSALTVEDVEVLQDFYVDVNHLLFFGDEMLGPLTVLFGS